MASICTNRTDRRPRSSRRTTRPGPDWEGRETKRVRTMNSSRRHLRSGLKAFFAAAIVWTSSIATAADVYVPFEGEKTTWHEGFDRYDFIMDDATGAITPMTAPASEVTSFGIDELVKGGKRRGVVIVPRKAAPGNPWSWRGCYW